MIVSEFLGEHAISGASGLTFSLDTQVEIGFALQPEMFFVKNGQIHSITTSLDSLNLHSIIVTPNDHKKSVEITLNEGVLTSVDGEDIGGASQVGFVLPEQVMPEEIYFGSLNGGWNLWDKVSY